MYINITRKRITRERVLKERHFKLPDVYTTVFYSMFIFPEKEV